MKKKTLSLLLIIAMLLSLCACGGSASAKNEGYYQYSSDSVTELYGYAAEDDYSNGATDTSEKMLNAPQDARKIIYTSDIEIETLNYDDSYKALTETVNKCGGYVSSSESYGGESYTGERTNRRLYITVRIPVENYNEFLSARDSIGNVTSFRETTDDITTQYVDTKARLDALTAQETRLLELIEKAASVEELLMIEDELSSVRYEIETYTSQMQTYDNLISYCTVNISLREANEYSKVNGSFGYKVAEALKSSWVALINFLQDIVLWVIRVLPFMLLFGCIGLVIYKAIKKSRKKTLAKYKAMREANNQNSEENINK